MSFLKTSMPYALTTGYTWDNTDDELSWNFLKKIAELDTVETIKIVDVLNTYPLQGMKSFISIIVRRINNKMSKRIKQKQ